MRSRTLAIACASVFAAHAHAEIIAFTNPDGANHFVWYGGLIDSPIGLDVTMDASSQTGAYGNIGQFMQINAVPNEGGGSTLVEGVFENTMLQTGGLVDRMLVGVDEGESIPSGTPWFYQGMIDHPFFGTELPLDVPTYLGIQFNPGDGVHYGWIGVTMFDAGDGSRQLDTFAWAYETEVGVPILAGAGVPTPGSLVAIALGGCCMTRRRRCN